MKCHRRRRRRRRKLSLLESFPCIVWVRVLEAYPSSPSLVFSSRLFWPSQTVCLWLVKNCTAIIPVNKMGRWVDRYTRKCVRQGSTWSDSKVHELIAVKVLRTSLLNTTVVAFKVLPLGSYATMPAPSPPFKNNFGIGFVEWPSELSLYYSWCHQCNQNAFISIFPFTNRKKSLGARSGE